MPRRNVPARTGSAARAKPAAAPTPGHGLGLGLGLGEHLESWRGVDYLVRSLAGSSSQTFYRCPGCDQQLSAAAGHVVAWPAADPDAQDRRHWHRACWAARDRRQPGVTRSRNAPRYG